MQRGKLQTLRCGALLRELHRPRERGLKSRIPVYASSWVRVVRSEWKRLYAISPPRDLYTLILRFDSLCEGEKRTGFVGLQVAPHAELSLQLPPELEVTLPDEQGMESI